MSNTRYGHSGVGGGNQDQGERKDEGWERRQGGDESGQPGRRGEPTADQPGDEQRQRSQPSPDTNTQVGMAGIGEASQRSAERLAAEPTADGASGDGSSGADSRGDSDGRTSDDPGAGTDQPPRMGGPLGPDREHPHLPEGAQTSETRGSGAGGFDVGVNAKVVGAVHQGAREEDPGEASGGEAR